MPGICPRCGETLITRTFGDESLDGCTSCGGIWFKYQELNRLTRDPKVGLMDVERAFYHAAKNLEMHGTMRCPQCDLALCAFRFPHTPSVSPFACPRCKGIWLDEGELQKIAERLAQARKPPAPPPAQTEEEKHREQARHVTGFLLSAPCPRCTQTNPAGTLRCWHCGAPLDSTSVMMLCPRCDRPLEQVQEEITGVSVELCRSCAGVWFQQGELAVFLRMGEEAIRHIQEGVILQGQTEENRTAKEGKQEKFRLTRCPACHYEMERRTFGEGDLHMEVCINCQSVWMDGGMLMAAYEVMMREGVFSLHSAERESDPWR